MTTAEPDHDDFGGLHRDLPRLMERRHALRWLGGVGLAGVLAACGSGGDSSTPTTAAGGATPATTTGSGSSPGGSSTAGTAAAAAAAGPEIPDETAGPFPADGSNGPDLLETEGVVRNDLTTSIGSFSGTADGIPTTIALTVVDASSGDPIAGAAVYAWHCTADGRYSIYEIEDQNYLRGVAETDDAGRVDFESIFPGCYNGRWPHVHFEVFSSLDDATAGNQAVKTSQLALPQADCDTVYADAAYGDSTRNLGGLSLSTDTVFRDGWESQLATVSGSNSDGYTASLLVRV